MGPRIRLSAPVAQQGPLEEGYRELLPKASPGENVDTEIVSRMEEEVMQLTGVGLEGLLNPSKVVNLERDRLLLTADLEECQDSKDRAEKERRLEKIEKQLYSEKRTVFRSWLKNVFVGQSAIALVLGGFASFDAFPGVTLDLSLRALGFWSYWLFVIPSLRARRPTGWEKKALNVAFLGSPIITIGIPFVLPEPSIVWSANLILLVASYAYGFLSSSEDESVKGFSGPLRWLDFGSGQERGMSAAKREEFQQRRQEAAEDSIMAENIPSGTAPDE